MLHDSETAGFEKVRKETIDNFESNYFTGFLLEKKCVKSFSNYIA